VPRKLSRGDRPSRATPAAGLGNKWVSLVPAAGKT